MPLSRTAGIPTHRPSRHGRQRRFYGRLILPTILTRLFRVYCGILKTPRILIPVTGTPMSKQTPNFPRAPWWGYSEEPKHRLNSYNPTACLAGFIIRFTDKSSGIYNIGCNITKEAYDFYMEQGFLNDMHCVLCYIRLMQYCEEAGANDIFDNIALKKNCVSKSSRASPKTPPNGKRDISANRHSFSTQATVFSTPTTRILPIMSATLLLRHSLQTVLGTSRGTGLNTRMNGRLPKTGGRVTARF